MDNWVHVKRMVSIPRSDVEVDIQVHINKHDTLENAFDEGLYYGIRATVECIDHWMNKNRPIIMIDNDK